MAASPAADLGRKRALDALERRFAAEKSSEQSRMLPRRPDEKRAGKIGSSAALQPISRGGDAETQIPAYLRLAQPVHSSLLATDLEFSNQQESMANKIVREFLLRGEFAQKYLHGSKSIQFDNYILLDNVVPKQNASVDPRRKALQCKSKRSKIHMSMRQHRICGSLDMPEEFHKFDLFVSMNKMWNDYISKLLKCSGNNQTSRAILEADLHGAILLVVECKVISFVRMSGIMIRETAETLGIVTRENKFRCTQFNAPFVEIFGSFPLSVSVTIFLSNCIFGTSVLVVPKKGSVFMLQASGWKITLYGDKLCSRKIAN